MTKNEIRHEMKLRIEAVGVAVEWALWEIAHDDFSQMSKRLEDMKMYSERARLDLDASYKTE